MILSLAIPSHFRALSSEFYQISSNRRILGWNYDPRPSILMATHSQGSRMWHRAALGLSADLSPVPSPDAIVRFSGSCENSQAIQLRLGLLLLSYHVLHSLSSSSHHT